MNSNKLIDDSPLLITGAWRSGTTLISRILNNHPDLDVTYDSVHFLRFSLNKYDPINDRANVEKLISDTSLRLADRYGFELSVQETLKNLDGDYSYKAIYSAIMKTFLLKTSKKKIWGEKTNLAWTKIPDFFDMYPLGRVLHIIRDPRAVLLSWKKFTNAPGNVYLDSILNCYDSMKLANTYKNEFFDKPYALITYEDLVSKPHQTLELVSKIFGIDFDAEMLNTSKFTDLIGKKWEANSIHDENMSGISTSAINRWKDKLEPWEIYLT